MINLGITEKYNKRCRKEKRHQLLMHFQIIITMLMKMWNKRVAKARSLFEVIVT